MIEIQLACTSEIVESVLIQAEDCEATERHKVPPVEHVHLALEFNVFPFNPYARALELQNLTVR